MSRSKNAKGQRGNREYWGKRKCKLTWHDAGPVTKKFTHRAERRQGKRDAHQQTD